QHEGEAAAGLRANRLDGGAGGVTRHGPGVAQAQIEVAMSVHVGEVGALAAGHEEGEAAGPAHHPVHGHAFEQRAAGPLVQREGPRVRLAEPPLLAGQERREPPAVPAHASAGARPTAASRAAPMTSRPSSMTASSAVSGASTRMTLPNVPAE